MKFRGVATHDLVERESVRVGHDFVVVGLNVPQELAYGLQNLLALDPVRIDLVEWLPLELGQLLQYHLFRLRFETILNSTYWIFDSILK